MNHFIKKISLLNIKNQLKKKKHFIFTLIHTIFISVITEDYIQQLALADPFPACLDIFHHRSYICILSEADQLHNRNIRLVRLLA